MQAEPDPGVRSLIYGFPQQFASLRDVADAFLLEIFRPSRLEDAAPAARRLLHQRHAERHADRPPDGRHVRPVRPGAPIRHGLQRRRQIVLPAPRHRKTWPSPRPASSPSTQSSSGGSGSSIAAPGPWPAWSWCCSPAAWSTVSYVSNVGLIGATNAQADRYVEQYTALTKSPGDAQRPASRCCRRSTPCAMPGGYDDRDAEHRFLAGFGLYQGYKLGSQSIAAYERALNNLLLPRLLARLETQMQGNLGNTDFLYQALKVYLILGRAARSTPAWSSNGWTPISPPPTRATPANAAIRAGAREARRRPAAEPGHGHSAERPAGRPGARHPAPDAARPAQLRPHPRQRGSAALPPWRYADHAGAAASSVLLLRSGKSLDTGVDGIFHLRRLPRHLRQAAARGHRRRRRG